MDGERESKSLFTSDEMSIIEGKIHQHLNKFKETSLMGETGICSLQHEIIASRVETAINSSTASQNKRILIGILIIVATQIILHFLVK